MKLFDLDKLLETFTGFLETKIELMKLDAKEELTLLISKALVFMAVAIFTLLALLFLSLGAATILNSYFENDYLGFLILGVIYLGLAGIIYVKRVLILESIKSQANRDAIE